MYNFLILGSVGSDAFDAIQERYRDYEVNVSVGADSLEGLRWEVSLLAAHLCIVCDIGSPASLNQVNAIRSDDQEIPIYLFGSIYRNASLSKFAALGLDGLVDTSAGYSDLFRILDAKISEWNIPKMVVEEDEEDYFDISEELPAKPLEVGSFSMGSCSKSSRELAIEIASHRGQNFWALEVEKGSDYIFVTREIFDAARVDSRNVLYPHLEPVDMIEEPIYCFLPGFEKPSLDWLESASFFVYLYFKGEEPDFSEFSEQVVSLKLEPLRERMLDRVEYFSRFHELVGRINLANTPKVSLSDAMILDILVSDEINSFSDLWHWISEQHSLPVTAESFNDMSFNQSWDSACQKLSDRLKDEYISLVREFSHNEPSEDMLRALGYISDEVDSLYAGRYE